MSTIIKTLVLAAFVFAVPAFSGAATFAYVNNQNEVSSVVADSAFQALAIAPNIDVHSGVLLLDSPEDNAILQN